MVLLIELSFEQGVDVVAHRHLEVVAVDIWHIGYGFMKLLYLYGLIHPILILNRSLQWIEYFQLIRQCLVELFQLLQLVVPLP